MTDSRIRELERQWKETGLAEDETTWLRARVQAGAVSNPELRAAAALQYPAALACVPDPPPDLPKLQWNWTREFERYVRVDATRVGRHEPPIMKKIRERETEPFLAEIRARTAILLTRRLLQEDLDGSGIPLNLIEQWLEALEAGEAVAEAETLRQIQSFADEEEELWHLQRLVEAFPLTPEGLFLLGSELDLVFNPNQVLRVLREHLVPWLLGYTKHAP